MSQEIYIDINYLTESERDIVLQVLARDEELRRQEKRRIGALKEELDGLRKKGASKEEKSSGKVCARCRNPFGIVFNSGALCPKCNEKVCKLCRVQLPNESWLCSLCARLREVRAESGAWFYEKISRKKGDKPQLYGSALLRASFRRAKPPSLEDKGRAEFESPPPPPVINQELKQSGLHKPIPVHMFPLKEQEVEEPEEVNSNYKPYTQTAVPVVPRPSEDKPYAEEEPHVAQLIENKTYSKAVPITRIHPDSDDEDRDKSTSSSRSVTPTGTTTDDTSFYDASEQPSVDPTATVEIMSRKFDRRSSSSTESEESVPTPRKPVMNGSALRNGDSHIPQIHVAERKSGAEFEDFLENNLDQAFQSKESIADSTDGDTDGKVLIAGCLTEKKQEEGIEEWEMGEERAVDYWPRSGHASESRAENEKRVVVDKRISESLALRKQEEEKVKTSGVLVDADKIDGEEASDYWSERKATRSVRLSTKGNEHKKKDVPFETRKAVTLGYELEEKEDKKDICKDVNPEAEKVEEIEEIQIVENKNSDDELGESMTEASGKNIKNNEFGHKGEAEPNPGSVLFEEKGKLKTSVHWEAVQVEIGDIESEEEASEGMHDTEMEQNVREHSRIVPEWRETTDSQNEEDTNGLRDTEMEQGDEENTERKIAGDMEESGVIEMEQEHDEHTGRKIKGDFEETNGRKIKDIVQEKDTREIKKDMEGESGTDIERKEEKIEQVKEEGLCREIEIAEIFDREYGMDEKTGSDSEGVTEKEDIEEPSRKRLSKRMELLLEKRQQSRKTKELKDVETNKSEIAIKESGKVVKKHVRWKDIEDEIEDKYGVIIESDEETGESAARHERLRKAELLLDRWQKRKQDSPEPEDTNMNTREETVSEVKGLDSEAAEDEKAKEIQTVTETKERIMDDEDENSYWTERRKARAKEHHGIDGDSSAYWQGRKKARVGRRVHVKDHKPSEPQENGYSLEEQRRKRQLLRAESPDSATTGEFFTPRSTPRGSGDSTPVPSEPTSEDDSKYQMASSQPEIAYDRYGVPQETTDESEEQPAPKEMPAPPAIVTTIVTEEEDTFPEPAREGNDDDIDQAFATYGIDLNSKQLGDQLNLGSRESIVSYYSDAGDGVYGNVKVTGSIQFGLKYDSKRAALEVQIHCAMDIAAVDEKKQRSDPYIKVYLLPDRTKGGKRKSKTKKNTLNPVFDEILTFKVGFEELLTRTLWLTVWNHDRFGHNEFLGEVMLPFDTYKQSGFSFDDPSPQWYTLSERRPEPSLMTYCGELEFALMFRPPDTIKDKKKKKKKNLGELHIRLIGAKNLPAKDANGFSDPFCKSYLLPDKSKKTKQKTQVVKKNLNPVWNYSYVYDDVTQEDLRDRVLELTVWDHDRGTSNDFLGGARLGLGSGAKDWDDAQGDEIVAWQAMLDHPNEWQKAIITLRSKMDSRFASLPQIFSSGNSPTPGESPIPCEDEPVINLTEVNGNTVQLSDQDTADQYHSTDSDDHNENQDSQVGNVLKDLGQIAIQVSQTTEATDSEDNKKQTLTDLATKESTSEPTTPVAQRRHTNTSFMPNQGLLAPSGFDRTRRRHSDFVKVPRPLNEEIALRDLQKDLGHRSSVPDAIDFPDCSGARRKAPYSPRMARRKVEMERIHPHKEERRKTLAELAVEAGYKTPPPEPSDEVDAPTPPPVALPVTQAEVHQENHNLENAPTGDEEIIISGEIFLSLHYDIKTKTFTVHVHSANNLAAVDTKKDTSDSYVKTYLLPDRAHRSKRKTKTVRGTVNPEFDEPLEYNMGFDELLTRTLWVTVWHDKFGRNCFLGEVQIPMNTHFDEDRPLEEKPLPKWYSLTDKSPEASSKTPEIILALKYMTPDKVRKLAKKGPVAKGELHVHLLEARNLPGKDADGMSDPYCKCFLLPDKKGKSKHKSPVINHSINPSWDYKFHYENFTQSELKERALEIGIYDYDRASSDEFLGGVRLGLGTSPNEWDDSNEDEAQVWHTILDRTNVWVQVVLPLRSTMTSSKNGAKVNVGYSRVN